MLQQGPKSQNITPSSHSCLTRQPPCFACALQACNCRLLIIVVWCTARQNDRNGETVKHFHNCINVLSQFRAYCTNLRQYSNRPKRGDTHDNCTDTILTISASSLCARKLCRPITLQPIAIDTCKKRCFPQIVLVQYKSKPYVGLQN